MGKIKVANRVGRGEPTGPPQPSYTTSDKSEQAMHTGLVHGGSWSRHLRSNIVIVIFEGAVATLFQAFFRNGHPINQTLETI